MAPVIRSAQAGSANRPPVNERVVAPAAGANVGVPQPDLVTLGVADTCSPAGRESVKETFVRAALALGLMMVKVRVVVPLTAIASGEKDLLMARPVVTTRVAEAVLPEDVVQRCGELFPLPKSLAP